MVTRRTNTRMLCVLGAICAGCASNAGTINEQAMLLESANAAAEAQRKPRLPWMRVQPTEYRIGARDLLEVDVYELEAPGQSKRLRVRVSHSGSILLPLIGAVPD